MHRSILQPECTWPRCASRARPLSMPRAPYQSLDACCLSAFGLTAPGAPGAPPLPMSASPAGRPSLWFQARRSHALADFLCTAPLYWLWPAPRHASAMVERLCMLPLPCMSTALSLCPVGPSRTCCAYFPSVVPPLCPKCPKGMRLISNTALAHPVCCPGFAGSVCTSTVSTPFCYETPPC